MKRDYPRLNLLEFGDHLLDTQDLDPVYVAFTKHAPPNIAQWLISYWCFYHVGVACWMSEQPPEHFWQWMETAAINTGKCPIPGRWPRSSERRHFRGKQAMDSLYSLQRCHLGDPEEILKFFSACPAGTKMVPFCEVQRRVQGIRGFGPWITFKIADMLERCLGIPVQFDPAEVMMYSEPRKGAVLAYRIDQGLLEDAEVDENEAVSYILSDMTQYYAAEDERKAPPRFERLVNIQEFETILCKWKSHMNGHYPLGKDTIEIKEGLEPWLKVSQYAKKFQESLPLAPPKTTSGT